MTRQRKDCRTPRTLHTATCLLWAGFALPVLNHGAEHDPKVVLLQLAAHATCSCGCRSIGSPDSGAGWLEDEAELPMIAVGLESVWSRGLYSLVESGDPLF